MINLGKEGSERGGEGEGEGEVIVHPKTLRRWSGNLDMGRGWGGGREGDGEGRVVFMGGGGCGCGWRLVVVGCMWLWISVLAVLHACDCNVFFVCVFYIRGCCAQVYVGEIVFLHM